MSIFVAGKEFRTLQDEFFVNGRKVVEVYVNGAKVYPEMEFAGGLIKVAGSGVVKPAEFVPAGAWAVDAADWDVFAGMSFYRGFGVVARASAVATITFDPMKTSVIEGPVFIQTDGRYVDAAELSTVEMTISVSIDERPGLKLYNDADRAAYNMLRSGVTLSLSELVYNGTGSNTWLGILRYRHEGQGNPAADFFLGRSVNYRREIGFEISHFVDDSLRPLLCSSYSVIGGQYSHHPIFVPIQEVLYKNFDYGTYYYQYGRSRGTRVKITERIPPASAFTVSESDLPPIPTE